MNFNIGDKVCVGRNLKQQGIVDLISDKYVRIMPTNFVTDIFWFSKDNVFYSNLVKEYEELIHGQEKRN